MKTIAQIREDLARVYDGNEDHSSIGFVNDDTVELIGATFVADEPSIFGKVNEDYVQRELEWYKSQSLSVMDIPGTIPQIWQAHASTNMEINSNYGYLTLSDGNHNQYINVLSKLLQDQNTRQATMIYTRPTMHKDWNRDGMSDFICTNTVQYFIRDNRLHSVVQMRSNDVVFGYRNDYAWQQYILEQLLLDLNSLGGFDLEKGEMIWHAASLHVYSRHYSLVEHYIETGEHWSEL